MSSGHNKVEAADKGDEGSQISAMKSNLRISAAISNKQKVYDSLLSQNSVDTKKAGAFQTVSAW